MSSTALPHRKSRSLKPATRALPGWNPLAADRIFSGLTLAAGLLILLILAAVVLFLLAQALPFKLDIFHCAKREGEKDKNKNKRDSTRKGRKAPDTQPRKPSSDSSSPF